MLAFLHFVILLRWGTNNAAVRWLLPIPDYSSDKNLYGAKTNSYNSGHVLVPDVFRCWLSKECLVRDCFLTRDMVLDSWSMYIEYAGVPRPPEEFLQSRAMRSASDNCDRCLSQRAGQLFSCPRTTLL